MDPPPVGFPRGKFDRDLMDEIIGLWKRLKPKVKAGGRVQMDAIELRATIFSVRANLDYVRSRRYFYRCLRSEDKVVFRLDDESFDQLNIKSKRVIQTLERHVKRANRTLLNGGLSRCIRVAHECMEKSPTLDATAYRIFQAITRD